jgi:hypothetical protein
MVKHVSQQLVNHVSYCGQLFRTIKSSIVSTTRGGSRNYSWGGGAKPYLGQGARAALRPPVGPGQSPGGGPESPRKLLEFRDFIGLKNVSQNVIF